MTRRMPGTWGQTGDAATLLESFYRTEPDDHAWLDGLYQAFVGLVPDALGVMVSTYRWSPGQVGYQPTALAGDPFMITRALETAHEADEEFLSSTAGANRRVLTMDELFGARLPGTPIGRLLASTGARDMFTLQTASLGVAHEGLAIVAPAATPIVLEPEARATWDRLGAHLSAALRLRRETAARHPVEMVLEPDGHVAHAEGAARSPATRESLGRAVVAIERSRRRDARTDPRAVLEAWRAIVERRWSLVDVVESDGRRFMLARVNPPAQLEDATLTPREKQVAALVVQGVPQKAVGYELDMSPSTVAFHMKNIARKVGATSSTDLVRVLAARLPAAGESREPAAADSTPPASGPGST